MSVRRTKTSYNKGRLRDFLLLMIQKYQPKCMLCDCHITEEGIPARGEDYITEHHLNGIHEDNRLCNRVIVHRACHKVYHVKDNIHSKNNSFWKQFNE